MYRQLVGPELWEAANYRLPPSGRHGLERGQVKAFCSWPHLSQSAEKTLVLVAAVELVSLQLRAGRQHPNDHVRR